MANEININNSLSVNKGALSLTKSGTGQVTMSGTTYNAQAISIATTSGGQALSLGGVGTAGYTFAKNTDSVNFCTIGIVVSATYYPVIKLKPGESALFRFGTNTPYALADTSAVVLDIMIVSD